MNSLHHEEDLCLLNLSLTKVLLDRHSRPRFYDLSKAQSLSDPLNALKILNSSRTDQERLYLAPEIVNPELKLPLMGDKLDIFSLGVMLFVSVFRVPPFKSSSLRDPLYRLLASKNP